MDRSEKLVRLFPSIGCDAALITSPENIFYLSGFTGGDDALLIITEEERIIITDSRYTIQAGGESPEYDLIGGNSRNIKLIAETLLRLGTRHIAFENGNMTVLLYQGLSKLLGQSEFVPLDNKLTAIRSEKDNYEVLKICEALRLADEAFSYVTPRLHTGISEVEVAAIIEGFMRREGAQKTSFDTICAFGERSAMPHGTATAGKIGTNGFLVMDYGCVFEGYCSDITRCVFFGKPDEMQQKIYDTVLSSQSAAEQMLSAGLIASDADKKARDVIAQNFDPKLFSHSLGHGVGICIHESPNLSPINHEPLKAGNVVTIEPGIYIEGFGGVRIEDMALITENGAKILTKSTKELIII